LDVNNTTENLEITSQTDLGESLIMDYDLNKTIEENEEIFRTGK